MAVNSGVVPVRIGGKFVGLGRLHVVADDVLQFGEKLFRGPIEFEEEIFQAGVVPADSKDIARAEDFRYAARDIHHLILTHEGAKLQGKVRLGGEAAADANGKSVFDIAAANTPCGGKGNVVDFRIAAPGAAAGNGHLELAPKIVQLAIAAQRAGHGERPGRSVGMLVVGEAGDGASSDGANHVSACPGGGQAGPLQALDNLGNGFDGDPVK